MFTVAEKVWYNAFIRDLFYTKNIKLLINNSFSFNLQNQLPQYVNFIQEVPVVKEDHVHLDTFVVIAQ